MQEKGSKALKVLASRRYNIKHNFIIIIIYQRWSAWWDLSAAGLRICRVDMRICREEVEILGKCLTSQQIAPFAFSLTYIYVHISLALYLCTYLRLYVPISIYLSLSLAISIARSFSLFSLSYSSLFSLYHFFSLFSLFSIYFLFLIKSCPWYAVLKSLDRYAVYCFDEVLHLLQVSDWHAQKFFAIKRSCVLEGAHLFMLVNH